MSSVSLSRRSPWGLFGGAAVLALSAALATAACSANDDVTGDDASPRTDAARDALPDAPARDAGRHRRDASRSPDGEAWDGFVPDVQAAEDAEGAEDMGATEDVAWPEGGALDVVLPDAAPDVYPAPHTPMGTVVANAGRILVTPNIIPVFYATDPYQADLEAFLSGLFSTSTWPAETAEYGIGAATVGAPIVMAGPAPATIDDPQIQSLLLSNLSGTSDGGVDAGPAWGTPAPNDLYVLFFPPETMVMTVCPGCFDYHSNVALSVSVGVIYAVVQEQSSTLGDITAGATHEIVEATTDPYIGQGYNDVDANDIAWGFSAGATGQELADMCDTYPSSYYTPPDLPYEVQRTWSNASGAASHDPCVPVPPGEVYFNSALLPTDDIYMPSLGAFTHGVYIAEGASRIVELDLYSDAPTSGPWTISAETYPTVSTDLEFTFSTNAGVNGDRVLMTLQSNAKGPTFFRIASTLGATTTYWFGVAGD
jgi:hypothetical protein